MIKEKVSPALVICQKQTDAQLVFRRLPRLKLLQNSCLQTLKAIFGHVLYLGLRSSLNGCTQTRSLNLSRCDAPSAKHLHTQSVLPRAGDGRWGGGEAGSGVTAVLGHVVLSGLQAVTAKQQASAFSTRGTARKILGNIDYWIFQQLHFSTTKYFSTYMCPGAPIIMKKQVYLCPEVQLKVCHGGPFNPCCISQLFF